MFESTRRRVWLINPRFQLSFLAYTIGISAVTAGIFYCANLYFFWKLNHMGQGAGLPQGHVFFRFIEEQKTMMNWVFFIVGSVATAFLAFAGLMLSHRVAGPLYRLHRHMLDVADGKTRNDVNFRDRDYFPELAAAYNRQLTQYREATGGAKVELKKSA